MEHLKISLSAAEFDAAVHGDAEVPALREAGDLAIYVKPGAMVSGAAGAVITFTVELPDGRPARAQAVTTVKNLRAALAALDGWAAAGYLERGAGN